MNWPPPSTPRWRLRWNGIRNRLNPRRRLRKVKWFVQRGRRGWADCDWWNLNTYTADVMIGMLTALKENGHGYPMKYTEDEWNERLQRMIDGFKAFIAINDLEYMTEDADGNYGVDRLKERALEYQQRRGFAAFAVSYQCLWD